MTPRKVWPDSDLSWDYDRLLDRLESALVRPLQIRIGVNCFAVGRTSALFKRIQIGGRGATSLLLRSNIILEQLLRAHPGTNHRELLGPIVATKDSHDFRFLIVNRAP